jgi:ubiquinone/menaquinone biosynthesis C-methylase UbiE
MFKNGPPHSKIVGNYYDKFESKNCLVNLIMSNYRKNLLNFLVNLDIRTVLDIGSGKGDLISLISADRPDMRFFGSDLWKDDTNLKYKNRTPIQWISANGEHLPFRKSSFDLILACEVLEHVDNPNKVLSEIQRVTKKYSLVTVPWEPIWKVLNIVRMKYLENYGNTPGHIHNWSKKNIEKLVRNFFAIEKSKVVFPWTFILAKLDVRSE